MSSTPKAHRAPTPPTVALLAAMPMELAPLRRRLNLTAINANTFRSQSANRTLIARITGIGGDRAIAAADSIIAEYQPHTIVHLGLAGGLNPALPAGAVVRIGKIVSDPATAAVSLHDPHAHATLLTVTQPVTSVADKTRLHQTTGADAVDMETWALARHLADRPVRLIALRAICDAAAQALPPDINQTLHPDGSPNIPGLCRLLSRRPGSIIGLCKLQRHAKRAANNLAATVNNLLATDFITTNT